MAAILIAAIFLLSIVFIIFAGMKAKLFAIGLFLFALAACTQRVKVPEPVEGPTTELCAIDSLMWRQPDSALMRLLPWFDTCCRDAACHFSTATAYNRHYANLLLSELLYKNDYPQTNRRELQQAVGYFDSLTVLADTRGVSLPPRPRRDARGASAQNNAFLDARAHYINGVGYYENDSAVEACKEYLKALEVMEGHFEEKELVGHKARFMAYTYTRLTELFSNLYLQEQAIYFARCSITYYQKQEVASWHTIFMLNKIGSQFDMMNQLDSASFYYHKAMKTLDDTTTLMSRDIAAHLICLEYKSGNCFADAATKRLRNLLQDSESDRESQVRYMYIGEVFYHERRYDSAWTYLNTVFQTTSVVGLKRQAAEWLIEICKIQGRDDDILEYADFLAPFANQEENQSAIKSQLTELYKTFGQTRLKKVHQKEMEKQFESTLFVITVLLVLILIIGLLYRRNRRGKKHLETLIETERNVHKMQQAALSGRLKRSNAAMKKKMTYKETSAKLDYRKQAETYSMEPICQWILSTCNAESNSIKTSIPVSSYADIALTDAQKTELKKAALAHHASLFEMLKQQYPELKEKDFQYCYLCLLGLDNAKIAVMTQLSYRTIWEREKRLQRIFHKKERISIILNEFITS